MTQQFTDSQKGTGSPTPYSYALREGTATQSGVIEFGNFSDGKILVDRLMKLLTIGGFKMKGTHDIWMNNEVWITFKHSGGDLLLTLDNWDLVFIMEVKAGKSLDKVCQILANQNDFILEIKGG